MQLARLISTASLTLALLAAGSVRLTGVVPPRQGGRLPDAVLEERNRSKHAFTLKRAWIQRKERQLSGEEKFRLVRPSLESMLSAALRAVSGDLRIPVVLGLYQDYAETPVSPTLLQQEFFDGPWTPGTLGDYYREVSFGLLDIAGNVYDWADLDSAEVYYTGGIYQGLTPYYAKTGELIKELLDTLDPAVDWGQYDNDGPDGVPNSGDDDGFVDVLLVIHPTRGAECDNSLHMWSHSWIYSGWPVSGGEPYSTLDAAVGGGVIKVDDYIIGPALSCDGGMIEIGVFCHELGHAIGLYDLYDWNGSSSGIGFWGLMGAGNWNEPSSPAHPCAWSREQLGWVDPIEVDWRPQSLTVGPVAQSGDVVKLVMPTKRFRHRRYASFPGGIGLVCGYTASEAGARGWPGGAGYGNEWRESVIREFHFDGTLPVTLQYDVNHDLEVTYGIEYDLGYLLLERAGAIETLAVYGSSGSSRETIDLGSRLPAGPCDVTLRFLFTSDFSYSDEDGGWSSLDGFGFTIDNIGIDGGGIDYFSDFEADAGGWREDSPPAEYILVENRQRVGFDAHLAAEGLLVWHAESSTARSYLGNTGGYSNMQARGLVLEEADGLYNLITSPFSGGNFGDLGDPYPGSTLNRTYNSSSDPSSRSNGDIATPVSITNVNVGSLNASALFRGGMPAPVIDAASPDTIDTEVQTAATIDIAGSSFLYGAGSYLALAADTLWADAVEWFGEERVVATFTIDGMVAGSWDLVVVSGDGQEAIAEQAIEVLSIYEAASVNTGRDYIEIEWSLRETEGVRGCLLFRAAEGEPFERLTADTLTSGAGLFGYRDLSVVPEIGYSYMIVTYTTGEDDKVLLLPGPYRIADLSFIVDQNFPNPFGMGTILGFFNPSAAVVSIDIYDVAGRHVASLGQEEYPRGTQRIAWAPPSELASGMYFCVFKRGSVTKSVKMVLIR
jgi:M6 family metalloprotease-like protein